MLGCKVGGWRARQGEKETGSAAILRSASTLRSSLICKIIDISFCLFFHCSLTKIDYLKKRYLQSVGFDTLWPCLHVLSFSVIRTDRKWQASQAKAVQCTNNVLKRSSQHFKMCFCFAVFGLYLLISLMIK